MTKIERIYDENGDWIGVNILEKLTLSDFEKRYPESCKKFKETFDEAKASNKESKC